MSCLTRDLSLYFIIHMGCAKVNNTQRKTQERSLFAAHVLCWYVCKHFYLRMNIRGGLRRDVATFNIQEVCLHDSSWSKRTSAVKGNGSRHHRYYLSSRTHCLSNAASIPAMYVMIRGKRRATGRGNRQGGVSSP